jgi:hypothetical protein
MPQVLNRYKSWIPPEAVYVGRPTKFGNPFTHQPAGTTLAQFIVKDRNASVDSYEAWLLAQPELVAAVKEELKGKDLVCYCKPMRCHGDVLLRIANED